MKIKNFKEYISLHITIDDYLHMYYNFNKGTFKNTSHDDIKRLLPFIKKVNYNSITRENILKGEVLLVKDKNNQILAYQNPFTENTNDSTENFNNRHKEKVNKLDKFLEDCKDNDKVSIIFTVEDDIDQFDEECLENMNLYELSKKKKELINNHEYKMSRLVQKELYFRSRQEHGTKKSKIRKLENKKKKEEW